MKKIIFILLGVILTFSSCEDFLAEDSKSLVTNSQYETEEGQQQLLNACYATAKIWYAKEEGFDYSDVGTDLYTWGEQHPTRSFFEYDPKQMNSDNGRLNILWVEFYKGINTCNRAIKVFEENSTFSESVTSRFLAEAHFLRALYYYHLVEQWGEIYLSETPTEEDIDVTVLSPVQKVYDLILKDLSYSESALKPGDYTADSDFGRVTLDAVYAFKARIHFTIASYINYAGNQAPYIFDTDKYDVSEQFTSAYNYAQLVIGNPAYSFYDDYNDLWKLENNTTSKNQEGIWAVNYSRNDYARINMDPSIYAAYTSTAKAYSEREGGHHGHLMWGMEFRDFPCMIRDLEYGRTFRRYCPTYYMISLFRNRTEYDARYDGQFRHMWKRNGSSSTKPIWSKYPMDSVMFASIGSPSDDDTIYYYGDTSLVILLYDYPSDRLVLRKGQKYYLDIDKRYHILDLDLMYDTITGAINNTGTSTREWFLQPKKFDDPGREAPDGNLSMRGARDAYAFRLAEMYLIAAESAARTSQDGVARTLLKTYRNSRAVEGYETKMEDEIDAAVLDKDFFLRERAMEFVGEQMRWYDLKRTYSPSAWRATLIARNPDVDNENFNVPELFSTNSVRHYLRPYPSGELKANLEENWKKIFGDNNGYGF